MPDAICVGQVWREVEKRESVCEVTRVDGDSVTLRERGSGYTGPINVHHLRRLYTLEVAS